MLAASICSDTQAEHSWVYYYIGLKLCFFFCLLKKSAYYSSLVYPLFQFKEPVMQDIP